MPESGQIWDQTEVVINHRTSLSIRPSWGARGEEIFRWGWGEGEKRKEGFSSLPFSLSSFPFPPETPDTQATIAQAKTTPPPHPSRAFFCPGKFVYFLLKMSPNVCLPELSQFLDSNAF